MTLAGYWAPTLRHDWPVRAGGWGGGEAGKAPSGQWVGRGVSSVSLVQSLQTPNETTHNSYSPTSIVLRIRTVQAGADPGAGVLEVKDPPSPYFGEPQFVETGENFECVCTKACRTY